MRSKIASFAALGTGLLLCLAAMAKDSAATHPATVTAPAEPAGMVSIFNGKDLTGWDGDPRLWSVRDGCICGQTTKQVATKGNTFCLWTGGTVADFELRFSYRQTGGDSGMQFRSKHLTGEKMPNKWVVGGYQGEIAGDATREGYLYEEKGKRGRMCLVGEKVTWTAEGKKSLSGMLDDPRSIAAGYKKNDWNDFIIIARGNHIQQFVNGIQTVDFTDQDPKNSAASGIVAIQIHAGGPMLIEMKDIRLKKYDDEKPAK